MWFNIFLNFLCLGLDSTCGSDSHSFIMYCIKMLLKLLSKSLGTVDFCFREVANSCFLCDVSCTIHDLEIIGHPFSHLSSMLQSPEQYRCKHRPLKFTGVTKNSLFSSAFFFPYLCIVIWQGAGWGWKGDTFTWLSLHLISLRAFGE